MIKNKSLKRRCAVCGDTSQTNVVLKWRRFADSKVFHICLLCAESNKVNANSVKEKIDSLYTTYLEV